jgi:hypothetical protein
MKRQSAITRCVLFALVGLFASRTVGAQTNNTPADAFLIKGVAADANGPLAGKVLIVMPISEEGKPVTLQSGAHATLSLDGTRNAKTHRWRYTYRIIGDPGLGPRLNPQTTTNAKGAFSVSVPRALFKGYRTGQLGLGVFVGLVSSFETEVIKYDVNAPTVHVGRLVFKPVHDPTK